MYQIKLNILADYHKKTVDTFFFGRALISLTSFSIFIHFKCLMSVSVLHNGI